MAASRDPHRQLRTGLAGAIASEFDPVLISRRRDLTKIDPSVAARLHLYLICRAPRIRAIASSWRVTKSLVQVDFEVELDGNVFGGMFTVENIWGWSTGRIVPDEANLRFTVLDEADEVVYEAHFGRWLAEFVHTGFSDGFPPELFDLDVLYIGQSYGQEGEKSVVTRLPTHERLLEVYEEAHELYQGQDVWLVLLGLQPTIRLVELIPEGPVPEDLDDVEAEFVRLMNADLSERQRVAFTEAALIRHFAPPLNEKFKDTFPSASHSTYLECYELELNSVAFAIRTDLIFARLKSASVEPEYHHFRSFPLDDPATRRAMFAFALPQD